MNRHFRRQAEAEERRNAKKVLKHILRKLDDPELQKKYKMSPEDVVRIKHNFIHGKTPDEVAKGLLEDFVKPVPA